MKTGKGSQVSGYSVSGAAGTGSLAEKNLNCHHQEDLAL